MPTSAVWEKVTGGRDLQLGLGDVQQMFSSTELLGVVLRGRSHYES